MSRMERWVAICCFLIGCSLVALWAQQQQSGGSGGGPVTQSGTWTVQPGNTANTTAWKVDGSAVTQPVSGTFWQATQPVSGTVTVNALPAGSNIIGKEVSVTGCGTTVFSQPLAAVPTSSTAVTTTTTCVYAIVIANTNASPQTITLTDNQGTPINAVGPAYSVPALSQITFPFNGVSFTSGIKWSAGGTGIVGGVIGVQ